MPHRGAPRAMRQPHINVIYACYLHKTFRETHGLKEAKYTICILQAPSWSWVLLVRLVDWLHEIF